MKVEELLRKAADHIDEVGWVTGVYFNTPLGDQRSAAQCCAVGGMLSASLGPGVEDWDARIPDDVREALVLLAEHLPMVLNDPFSTVFAWNDEAKNKAEVVQFLRDMAGVAKVQGL